MYGFCRISAESFYFMYLFQSKDLYVTMWKKICGCHNWFIYIMMFRVHFFLFHIFLILKICIMYSTHFLLNLLSYLKMKNCINLELWILSSILGKMLTETFENIRLPLRKKVFFKNWNFWKYQVGTMKESFFQEVLKFY